MGHLITIKWRGADGWPRSANSEINQIIRGTGAPTDRLIDGQGSSSL